MFKVKICGVSEVSHINSAVTAGADYVGFVFFEKSKRNISLQKANELAKLVPSIYIKCAVTAWNRMCSVI